MQPDVQTIAIATSADSVAIMKFVTRQPSRNGHPGWQREASDAAIAAELARAGMEGRDWVRVSLADLPADRAHRQAWRLVNGKVVVDPAKIAPPALSNVVPLQTDASAEEPLPRFLQQETTIPEMQTRLSDFTARTESAVKEARQTFDALRKAGGERAAMLESRISDLEARLAALEGILTRVAEHFEGGQG